MAIKFDELLEALDPSLDKFEEDFDSMWIIIPTERRYDDLTADDYDEFINKYGTFNSRQECWDKIDELAPDRWDAFIPMRIEGVNEAYETDVEIKAKPGDPYYTGDKIESKPGDPYFEALNEDFSEDNIDYIGERLSRHIRRNSWDSFFDYPALAVRDNSGNNRYFVIKSNKNSIIITDEDHKPIYSHELNSNNDLKTIINEAAKEIINNVKRFKIVHVNEALNESMTKAELQTKKYIISYLNRDYPKVASSLNDFDFKLTEDPDTTGYIDLNTKHVVLNRNLSMDDAIRCILDPLREKEFKQALKDPEFIQQMSAENKEIEKLLREKDGSLNESKLNEILSESKFKDPIRFKISIIEGPVLKQESDKYALTPSYIKKAMSGRFNDLTNISIKPEVLIDNQDGTGEICFPGREDLIDIIRDYFSKKYKYHEIEIL